MDEIEKACGCGQKETEDSCGCNAESNCGCNHGNADENPTVTLTLDDDSELECNIVGTFDIEETEYIVLLPLGDEEVLIYRYEQADGDVTLGLIESDEEFKIVSETFYELFGEDEE